MTYPFSSPVPLSGKTYYWLVPTYAQYNNSLIFGSSGNAYADGFWSGNPGTDAYFMMQ